MQDFWDSRSYKSGLSQQLLVWGPVNSFRKAAKFGGKNFNQNCWPSPSSLSFVWPYNQLLTLGLYWPKFDWLSDLTDFVLGMLLHLERKEAHQTPMHRCLGIKAPHCNMMRKVPWSISMAFPWLFSLLMSASNLCPCTFSTCLGIKLLTPTSSKDAHLSFWKFCVGGSVLFIPNSISRSRRLI